MPGWRNSLWGPESLAGPGIFPDEFEANAESGEGPGPCPINDPGEVSDESYPHRETEGPGTLAGPARPGHRPGPGRSRGPRVPERRPGHDGLGGPAPMAGCLDGDPH